MLRQLLQFYFNTHSIPILLIPDAHRSLHHRTFGGRLDTMNALVAYFNTSSALRLQSLPRVLANRKDDLIKAMKNR